MTKRTRNIYIRLAIQVILIVYFCTAQVVFALRHPKFTSTERFLHTKDVMMFKKVPYGDGRDK